MRQLLKLQGLENLCPKKNSRGLNQILHQIGRVTVDELVTDAILSEAVQKAGVLFSWKVVMRTPLN
jgi:hypothetical protein